MRMATGFVLALALAPLGCGPSGVRHDIEERPLDQAVAMDTIVQALTNKDVQSATFVTVLLPDRTEWTVDVVGANLPIAVEFLTAQDRERIGDRVPIQATPTEMPRVVNVERKDTGAILMLRVFTDQHFRFQPNPPSDMPEAPYTIREVQARLRRDVSISSPGTGPTTRRRRRRRSAWDPTTPQPRRPARPPRERPRRSWSPTSAIPTSVSGSSSGPSCATTGACAPSRTPRPTSWPSRCAACCPPRVWPSPTCRASPWPRSSPP